MKLHWARSQRWLSAPPARREFLRELGLVGAAALLYFLVRGAVQDRAAEAFARARALLELEQTLGLAWELAVHEAALSANLIVDLANAVYFWGHMPLLIVLALWLWFRDRATWRWLRAALLVSSLLGIVCYVVWPTAPPRLMPELGYIDTLASRAAASYQAQEVGPFVNPYAALPSLHVGWALLAGVACLACRDDRESVCVGRPGCCSRSCCRRHNPGRSSRPPITGCSTRRRVSRWSRSPCWSPILCSGCGLT